MVQRLEIPFLHISQAHMACGSKDGETQYKAAQPSFIVQLWEYHDWDSNVDKKLKDFFLIIDFFCQTYPKFHLMFYQASPIVS